MAFLNVFFIFFSSNDLAHVRVELESVLASGIRSVAVVFMHSHAFAEHEHEHEHEQAVGRLARALGFTQVSVRRVCACVSARYSNYVL